MIGVMERDALGRLTKDNPWAFKKGHIPKSGFKKGNDYGKSRKGIRTRAKEIAWKVNENGCWICTSHVPNTYGYPQCRINYKSRMISHIMYERYKGEIPAGLCACHTCDNPICINPDHLVLGTNKYNSKDMVRKGRQSHIGSPGLKGEEHHQAKLTEDQVLEIINDTQLNQKQLSIKFNISQQVISKIRNGKAWKHLKRSVN
jgi:hypothetical protein